MSHATVSAGAGLLGLAGVLLAGCASGSRAPYAGNTGGAQPFVVEVRDTRTHEEVIDVPPERVWVAVPQAFADLGYQAGPSTKPGERLFLTPHMSIRGRLYTGTPNSAFLDCGRTAAGSQASDSYSVTFAILMWVNPQPGGGTKVEVLIDGKALQRELSSNSVPCQGTGRLERELVQALRARLGAKPGGGL